MMFPTKQILLFFILGLAGAGLSSSPPRSTVTVSPLDPTGTPAPTEPPLEAPPPSTDRATEHLILGILRNTKTRRKAKKCNNISNEGLFVSKTLDFLSQWKAMTGVPGEAKQTEKQILERLVVYQTVFLTTRAESEHNSFPDNIVDQIQSIGTFVRQPGALVGSDPRVLEALDIVLDDICADTGEAQVAPRIQQIADIVLRGLALNPGVSRSCEQKETPDSSELLG
ncbi:hypothetical protein PG990_000038 [Apiospora arundinis]